MSNKANELKIVNVWFGALLSPLLLWFVEQVLSLPAVLEELTKFTLLYFLLKGGGQSKGSTAFTLGAVFGFSEAVLYLLNANLLLNVSGWLGRLFLTVPMHATTVAVMWLLWERNRWLGLVLAVAIHLVFNRLV